MESKTEDDEIIILSPNPSDFNEVSEIQESKDDVEAGHLFDELEIIDRGKQGFHDMEANKKTPIETDDGISTNHNNSEGSSEAFHNGNEAKYTKNQPIIPEVSNLQSLHKNTPSSGSGGLKRLRLESLNSKPNFFRDQIQQKEFKMPKVSVPEMYTPASGEDYNDTSDGHSFNNRKDFDLNGINSASSREKYQHVQRFENLENKDYVDNKDGDVELITISSDEDARSNSFNNFNESDDDIIILDASEAARSGKFKQSSFNKTPFSTYTGLQTDVIDPDNLYNQPLPGFNDPNSNVPIGEVRKNESQQKLENYVAEQSSLIVNHRSVSEEKDKFLNALNSVSESVVNLSAQANSYRDKTDGHSMQLYQSILNVLMDKNAHLHQLRNKFAEAKAKFDGITSRLRNINESIRILSVNNGINLNPFAGNGFLSNSGFSSNIYTDTGDEQHLQKLLDDIQPDEELADGMELTPPELAVNLLKHQRLGLSWLLKKEKSEKSGAILADDMGLGKTVQALALILANKPSTDEDKTTLIIAPVSLLRQWSAEITSKIKPNVEMKLGVFHGAEKRILSLPRSMKSYDIILTSYGTLASEWKKHYREALIEAKVNRNRNVLPDLNSGGKSYISPFFSPESTFYRIILDEAQNIKNKLAINSKAVACLRGNKRLCLSGTPMQNNVEELYPLIRFLKIRPYSSELRFRTDIVLPMKSKSRLDDQSKQQSLNKLRAVLKAILLRRSKNSLIDGKPILSLPEKHIISDSIVMEEQESKFYGELESGIQKKAKRLFNEKNMGSVSNILVLLLKLRQACCHSLLVDLGEYKKSKQENPKRMDSNRLRHVYEMVNSVTPKVKQTIVDSVNESKDFSEGAFSCPICYDVYDFDSVSVFIKCGHIVCENCVDDFFTRNEVGDSESSRIASCITCEEIVKESEVISYSYYDKIINENYSIHQLDSLVSSESHSSNRLKNGDMIELLMKKNNGFQYSAKLRKCLALIKEVFSSYPGEKIIIFSQFTTLFDVMKFVLNENDIPFLRYDGSMSLNDRNLTIKRFYQEETKVLLLSLKSGNVGLTLTCASHVIMMDPFWNPYVEEQAMNRAHRIGQQREVYVHRILVQNTIESRIMELQENKKKLIESALDENGMKFVGRLGQRELGFLFGLNGLR